SAARPLLWAGLGLVGIAFGAWAATQLTSQPHAIRYLSPDHPIRLDYEALDSTGAPLAQVELLVRSSAAPITSDPALLRLVDGFAREIGSLPGARGAVSLPLLLREAGFRATKVNTPETPADLPADFQLAEIMERQAVELQPFQAEGGRLLRISLAIDTLGPEELTVLRAEIERLFAARLAPKGLSLQVTGSYPLLVATQGAVLVTLRTSLLITALLMQGVLVIALRSWRLGLAALIPNAFPVAAVMATMTLAGIPIDIGTSMAAAIALGVAVDDTLHVLCAWQAAQQTTSEPGLDPLAKTARSAGAAILLSSVVVAAGFLSITGAPFAPTRNFGILCATAMLAALIGDLLLLPACLRLTGASSAPTPAEDLPEAQAEATGS
ncbi:MAG: MMPL family transporter, partial [Planctomycetes bacterium]|nr:MMPL family transporter [Planctomycetota bacterium]